MGLMGGGHGSSESRAEGVRGGSLCLEGEAWDQGSAYQVAGSGSGSGRSQGSRVTIPVHSLETVWKQRWYHPCLLSALL